MQADTDARIRQRAYEIWLREGRPHGRDKDHWAMAKREIAAESDQPQPGGATKSAGTKQPARKKAAPAATTQAMAEGKMGAEAVKASPKPRRTRQPKEK